MSVSDLRAALVNLGNAIRGKTGGTSNMTLKQMASALAGVTVVGDNPAFRFGDYVENVGQYGYNLNCTNSSSVSYSRPLNAFFYSSITSVSPNLTGTYNSSLYGIRWLGSYLSSYCLGMDNPFLTYIDYPNAIEPSQSSGSYGMFANNMTASKLKLLKLDNLQYIPSSYLGIGGTSNALLYIPNVSYIGNSGLYASWSSIYAPTLTSAGSYTLRAYSIYAPNLEQCGTYCFTGLGVTRITSDMFPRLKSVGATCFGQISGLRYIHLPALESWGGYAFSYYASAYPNVSEMHFPNLKVVPKIFSGYGSSSTLKKLYVERVESFSSYALSGCYNLEVLDMRYVKSVPTLGNWALGTSSLPKCTAYVPMSLLESFNASASWSGKVSSFVGV